MNVATKYIPVNNCELYTANAREINTLVKPANLLTNC